MDHRCLTDGGSKLSNVWYTATHVFKRRIENLFVRLESNGRVAADVVSHLERKVSDADLVVVSDIEDLTHRPWFRNQSEECRHNVSNPREASSLRPVAMDRQGLTLERLSDERREHHAVSMALTRANRVEQPNDDDR